VEVIATNIIAKRYVFEYTEISTVFFTTHQRL
jgi:hypothetical protein